MGVGLGVIQGVVAGVVAGVLIDLGRRRVNRFKNLVPYVMYKYQFTLSIFSLPIYRLSIRIKTTLLVVYSFLCISYVNCNSSATECNYISFTFSIITISLIDFV